MIGCELSRFKSPMYVADTNIELHRGGLLILVHPNMSTYTHSK